MIDVVSLNSSFFVGMIIISVVVVISSRVYLCSSVGGFLGSRIDGCETELLGPDMSL